MIDQPVRITAMLFSVETMFLDQGSQHVCSIPGTCTSRVVFEIICCIVFSPMLYKAVPVYLECQPGQGNAALTVDVSLGLKSVAECAKSMQILVLRRYVQLLLN